jgi:DNA-binding LacI/PurR family transcriptional regulator
MLNISSMTANRAMQLLAEKGLLVRQRKAGTFIGEGLEMPASVMRKRVHLLLTHGIWPDEQSAADTHLNQLLCGILGVMSGVSIQVDIVVPQEVREFVRQIVDNFSLNGEVAGVILVRSTPEIQRQLVDSGIPTVVFGSVFPGIIGLSSVDVDQEQIGRLSAAYLKKARHRHIAALMLGQWSPGDNAFVSGLMGTLQAESPDTHVDLQSVPVDDDICRGMVQSILRREPRPTAIVVRSPWLARNAADVARSLGLRIPSDVDLVIGNHHEVEIDERRLPGARAKESMLECGRKLGRMLTELSQNHLSGCRQEFMPAEFVEK